MNKEEELFQKRLLDLGQMSYRKGIVVFSDFLNLNELNICHYTKNFLPVKYKTYGGYEHAERQIVAFIPDALYHEWNYPIDCLKITPLSTKFSEDLHHRDFLGAILNLGIERSKIGDIVLQRNEAYLYCHQKISTFIISELTRIKHTSVLAKIVDVKEINVEIKLEDRKGTVSSIRLDSLMALAFRSSRSSLTNLIESKKVFVNGKLITSNGYTLKENDIVSVRKMGRFIYKGILSQTKKGRYFVLIQKYI